MGDSRNRELEGMLKGMLNIGGAPGAAAPPSADDARAAQIADLQRGLSATQQSLAQVASRQQQLQQAAAALPTMPPEQQAHVQPQLVALAQQLQVRWPRTCPGSGAAAVSVRLGGCRGGRRGLRGAVPPARSARSAPRRRQRRPPRPHPPTPHDYR